MVNPISKAHNVVADGIALIRARANEFFNNAASDFSRECGPFTLENTFFASICQGKQNMDSDAAQRFFEAENPARFGSPSAFIQAKQKIRPEAFKFLSDYFADTISTDLPAARYKNRILLGVDGSKVNINLDPENIDCYFPPKKEGGKGYCQVHLNGMTDLLTSLIVDFDIQPGRHSSERGCVKIFV